MKIADQPAFPIVGQNSVKSPGMTLRQYYAGQALMGMMANMGQLSSHPSEYGVGKQCLAAADDLIAELEKTQP